MSIYCTRYLSFLLFFASCDCIQQLQGYVIDAETKRPLQDVFYKERLLTAKEKQALPNDTAYRYYRQTDSTGWFNASRLANGFNCSPHLIIWLDKDGYQPVRLEWQRNKTSSDTLIINLHKKDED